MRKICFFIHFSLVVMVHSQGSGQGPEEDVATPTTPAIPSTTISTTTTSTTTTTTTKKPPRRTTTKRPVQSEGVPKFNHTEYQFGSYCSCDLMPKVCDVNCCCDKSCSLQDTRSFSECIKVVPGDLIDPKYCYQTDFIFANHSQFAVERKSDDLLCLFKDNFPQHAILLDRKGIENVTEFNKLKSRHGRFQWPDYSQENPFSKELYQVGDPIWTFHRVGDNKLGLLSLPAKLNSDLCNLYEHVEYMKDRSTTCQLSLNDVTDCSRQEALNVNTYLDNILVVKSPQLFKNQTNPFVLQVQIQLCERNRSKCLDYSSDGKKTLPRPTFDCRNVLISLEYRIVHNGQDGIEEVVAFVELKDFGKNENLVVQKFAYSHYWISDNSTDDDTPRSGNPGYLVGKPLLVGRLGQMEQEPNDGSDPGWIIHYPLENVENSFSLMPFPQNGGKCSDETPRTEINFGENVQMGCFIQYTEKRIDCANIRNRTRHMLFGSKTIESLKHLRVASFGNSDPQRPGEWVPILFQTEPNFEETAPPRSDLKTCTNILTELQIEVLYSKVGSLIHPQSKVIGIKYKFGTLRDLKFECVGNACLVPNAHQNVLVTSSVSFVDVTQPAMDRFAEFPVIEAKFPHDFFYPFVTEYKDQVSHSIPLKCCNVTLFVFLYLYVRVTKEFFI